MILGCWGKTGGCRGVPHMSLEHDQWWDDVLSQGDSSQHTGDSASWVTGGRRLAGVAQQGVSKMIHHFYWWTKFETIIFITLSSIVFYQFSVGSLDLICEFDILLSCDWSGGEWTRQESGDQEDQWFKSHCHATSTTGTWTLQVQNLTKRRQFNDL